jgi:hypothetical protein
VLRLTLVEDAQLKPDTVLGAFLTGVRLGIKEVDVADDDADLLEDKCLEHDCMLCGAPSQEGYGDFSVSYVRKR